MFNERLGRHKIKQAMKCGMDAIDLEACRHGDSTRFFSSNNLGPQLGRRISKESRKSNGLAKSADLRATKNLVADTKAAHDKYVVRQYQLAAH